MVIPCIVSCAVRRTVFTLRGGYESDVLVTPRGRVLPRGRPRNSRGSLVRVTQNSGRRCLPAVGAGAARPCFHHNAPPRQRRQSAHCPCRSSCVHVGGIWRLPIFEFPSAPFRARSALSTSSSPQCSEGRTGPIGRARICPILGLPTGARVEIRGGVWAVPPTLSTHPFLRPCAVSISKYSQATCPPRKPSQCEAFLRARACAHAHHTTAGARACTPAGTDVQILGGRGGRSRWDIYVVVPVPKVV